MAPQTIETRVRSLEERVTKLEELPVRIDDLQLQILQFRDEARSEFSAVRHEMREGFVEVYRQIDEARRETRVLHEDVIRRIVLLGEAGPARRRAAVPRGPRKKR